MTEANVTAQALTGEQVVLDTSVEATKPFGFSSGQLVRFTKSRDNGKVARVVGVSDGMLWFRVLPPSGHVDETQLPVRTTSARCQAEYIRQYGWMPIDGEPAGGSPEA